MSKKLIVTILISSAFVSFLAYIFYQTFYKYQPEVDQILAEIPAEDKELPPNVLKVFRNTKEVNSIYHFTTTNLRISANEKYGRVRNLEWHLFGVVWGVALPIRIGEKEEFAYFANKVFLGKDKSGNNIYGFKDAAKFYYDKDWNDLTEKEVLVFLVYARSSFYIYPSNSEMFHKKLAEFTEVYKKNSADFFQ